MSASTCSKKAADNDAEPKPISNEEVFSLLDSLKSDVLSLNSACSSDAAKMQSPQMVLSSPPPAFSPYTSLQHHTTSVYDCFMQEPYCSANCFGPLNSDSSNFAECVSL
ncbi:hypothetical protein O181_007324 [Austropuccinia psidii MF-1]|uniref:Uncharacterized protein n=1 Tax=Austropuccinia psidii MF-1 TaxID=1389203 RepID=A0A9Q3BKP7_9BASI|nr:hypothetical protein [Austropuccinia psidii MF-1]